MRLAVRRPATAVAAVAAALVLAACGDDAPTRSATTAPPETTPAATPAATATAATTATPSGGPGCPLLAAAPAGATVVRITVDGSRVETPSRTVSVKTGTKVRLEVTADVADEVHVHTYDERVDTVPGCTVALDFTANIPGTVEVELEKAHKPLVEIKAS